MTEDQKEQQALYRKKWYLENKDQILSKQKERDSTPESKQRKKEYHTKIYSEKKQQYRERNRRNTLNQYGLTQEDYERMFSSQNGCCAMCGKEFTKTAHVDHNHITGAVRALLCGFCNTGLGIYEKYKQDFEDYLCKYPQ